MSSPIPSTGESWKIILMILAGFSCFSFADVFSKTLLQDYSVWQLLTINGISASIFLGGWIYKSKGIDGFKSKKIKWHMARALTTFATATCVVTALKTIPLADFYGIIFAAPFLLLILIHFFLHEPIGIQRWMSVLVGFIGVIILAGPQFDVLGIGVAFAIMAAIFIAVSNILIRKIGSDDHVALYGFYPFLLISILSLPLTILSFEMPSQSSIVHFSFNSFFLVLAVILVAYSTAKAKETAAIAPFVYVQIIWGTIFGYFIFGDSLSYTTVIGLSLIISAGLYNIYRERKVKKFIK